jgi:hypothetical protein
MNGYTPLFYYNIICFMCELDNTMLLQHQMPGLGHLATLRLAARATVKYVMNEHITLRTEVIFAILTSITIEWAHPLADARRRSSLERQCTRVAVGAWLTD